MNLKDNKIFDYTDGYDPKANAISMYVGENGAGKTRLITEIYSINGQVFPQKILLTDSFPIDSREYVKVLQKEGILDELQRKEFDSSQLETANFLSGKEYKRIDYIMIYLPEIVDERYSNDDVSQLFGKGIGIESNSINACNYFYFEVTNKDGTVYDSFQLGVGERILLSYSLLLFEENKTIFIDEPFNYLSVSSAYTIAKMIIYSSCVKKNTFHLSTNSLDVIDYLLFFRMKIVLYLLQESGMEPLKIDIDGYYRYFEDRYKFFHYYNLEVFVEDALTCKFLMELIPGAKYHIMKGSGNLELLCRTLVCLKSHCKEMDELISRFLVIYDGDMIKENQPEFVFYMPVADVETAALAFLKEDIDSLSSDVILKSQIKTAIATREKHDAYLKVKQILHFDDHKMISIVLSHNTDSVNVFRDKVIDYCQRHKFLNMGGIEREC